MAKRPAKKAQKKGSSKGKAKKAASKAKAPAKRAAPKRASPKRAAVKPAKKAPKQMPRRTLTVVVPQAITLALPPVLHDRLKGLSQVMGLSVEGVVRQAVTEFADTWEEHHRTVSALAEGSDRMALIVRETD